jgi:hypothetical protein
MNRLSIPITAAFCLIVNGLIAQRVPGDKVPPAVRAAHAAKCPDAKDVTWEKEKGNFEANWGGKSKEDTSVLFRPDGSFVEMVVATQVTSLPSAVISYVKDHYPTSKITEAGKINWPGGKTGWEAEVKAKDLVFDEQGKFIKID